MTEAVNFQTGTMRKLRNASNTELVKEARKAAPLYGNDHGVLVTILADRLKLYSKEKRRSYNVSKG
jgi:hypothetical protein